MFESSILKASAQRKFFRNHSPKVRDQYLLSKQERQVKQATKMLFSHFDYDGSGALDSKELAELYNQQGVPVSVLHIQQLYNK
jgi:Ca2+-binding EF-hand superfamily protein